MCHSCLLLHSTRPPAASGLRCLCVVMETSELGMTEPIQPPRLALTAFLRSPALRYFNKAMIRWCQNSPLTRLRPSVSKLPSYSAYIKHVCHLKLTNTFYILFKPIFNYVHINWSYVINKYCFCVTVFFLFACQCSVFLSDKVVLEK